MCLNSYCEGVSIPRQANEKVVLPSARDVSLAVHKDVDNPHAHLTTMAAIWGQLIHHDISHTPQMAGELIFLCGMMLILIDSFMHDVSSDSHESHLVTYWNILSFIKISNSIFRYRRRMNNAAISWILVEYNNSFNFDWRNWWWFLVSVMILSNSWRSAMNL